MTLSMLMTGFMALSYDPKDDLFKAKTFLQKAEGLSHNDWNTLINLVREESNTDITGSRYTYLPTEEEMTVKAVEDFCARMTEKAIASGIIAAHCKNRTETKIALEKALGPNSIKLIFIDYRLW
jgi:hypothetical protein